MWKRANRRTMRTHTKTVGDDEKTYSSYLEAIDTDVDEHSRKKRRR